MLRGLDQNEVVSDSKFHHFLLVLFSLLNILRLLDLTLGSSKLPLPDLFDHVGQFLEFLWSDAFGGSDEVYPSFFLIFGP